MKRSDQNSTCKYLFRTTLRTKDAKRITPHEVLRAYDVLAHFRNLCAYDERLYCAKVGNDGYASVVKIMEIGLGDLPRFQQAPDAASAANQSGAASSSSVSRGEPARCKLQRE